MKHKTTKQTQKKAGVQKKKNQVLLIDVVAKEIRIIDTPKTREEYIEVLGFRSIEEFKLENGDVLLVDENGLNKNNSEINGWFIYEFNEPVWFCKSRFYPIMNNTIVATLDVDKTNYQLPNMPIEELRQAVSFQGNKPLPKLTFSVERIEKI